MALIVCTIAMLSFGQVLFKTASSHLVLSQPSTWLTVPLVAALAIYGLATVTWLVVLSRVPLSFAFPFYGLSFLLVPVAAAIFLGEPLRWQTLAGGLVILMGIALTGWKPQA
nr:MULTISPECIES: EamA family transporter [unclassified Luteimonas]